MSGTNFIITNSTHQDFDASKVNTGKTPNCTNEKIADKKRTRTTIDRANGSGRSNKRIRINKDCVNQANKKNKSNKAKNKKRVQINKDCVIISTEGLHRPDRTEWPEYRYHQVDETWQRNACNRMGLQFREVFQCQRGGTNVILTRPNSATLHNVGGDGNCLFRSLSYVITGSEQQHLEVRTALVSYMLSIESFLVGYGDDGNYNYLQPFGHTTVQSYIDSTGMNRAGTWGSELEMMCLSHMLNTVVYSFGAGNNNWEVFAYNFIDRTLTCDYTQKSIYLWFSSSHFKVVTSVIGEDVC